MPKLTKPTIIIPEGPPPSFLQKEDIVVGTDAEAIPGFHVRIEWVGVSWTTGRQFNATWDRFEPYSFTLGTGWEIDAFEEGIPGMRVGGRRKIIAPPEKGYREPRFGLTPGETLVFVVDLLAVG